MAAQPLSFQVTAVPSHMPSRLCLALVLPLAMAQAHH